VGGFFQDLLGSFLSEEGKREEEGKGTGGKKRKKEEEKTSRALEF